jgi:hypothetical protein
MRFVRLLIAALLLGNAELLSAMPLYCSDWFAAARVRPGLMCMLDCMAIRTSLTTAICPNWCADLCELNFGGVAFFEISKLYPALTMSERALVSEFPWEMTRAYAYSWKAERLCLTIYKGSTANDESDACRHFVWAGLLTSHFGPRFSVTVLDAHEDTLLQSVEEKAMDLANNRAGVLACENLRLISQCNGENLLKTFLDSLVQKRLIVLSPRGKKFK